MKSLTLVGPRQMPVLPRLKLRQRTRTCSSDSGCEVGCETPNDLLEDTLSSWTGRLEGVLGQEVARARELTSWAKEALRQNESGDDGSREEVLESWRRQMEGVMEFTADLVECVNNDTKEMMTEALGISSSPSDTSLTIEEKEEDEEKEEEIMKLFWTPCIFPSSRNFPKSMRSRKRGDNNKKEAGTELKMNPLQFDTATSKQQDKKETMNECKGFKIYQGLKMFQSTLDSEDIFEDWNWNLWEFEESEDIFADWLWNLEPKVDLRMKFYDDPKIEETYNDFHFWNLNQPAISEAMALDVLASDDIEACITPDSGCFSLRVEEEKGKLKLDKWMNCKYWEETFQNESILHSLLDDEVQEGDKTPGRTVNFWDESANNQAAVELQMKQEKEEEKEKEKGKEKEKEKGKEKEKEKEKEAEYLWEDKEIIFGLVQKELKPQSTQYFPWEDPDTMAGLVEDMKPARRASGDSTFLWDDPAAIGMLLTDEEDESYLPWDDKMDMSEELPSATLEEADVSPHPWEWMDNKALHFLAEEEPVHISWEDWSLWDQFGTTQEIMQAYEETSINRPSKKMKKAPQVNIQEAFWSITMADDNAKIEKLSQVTQNLPTWQSPDVYADSWDHDIPKASIWKSGNQHKDPVNTFKAYRYIFYENDDFKYDKKIKKSKDEAIYDDMLDIYSEWAPNVLADDRVEKKRQRRGRGRGKVHRAPVPVNGDRVQHDGGTGTAVKRPGTPTIIFKKTKSWDFESSWVESKTPKKERKTSQGWKAGKTRRQLHAKIYAKQPRSCKAAFPA